MEKDKIYEGERGRFYALNIILSHSPLLFFICWGKEKFWFNDCPNSLDSLSLSLQLKLCNFCMHYQEWHQIFLCHPCYFLTIHQSNITTHMYLCIQDLYLFDLRQSEHNSMDIVKLLTLKILFGFIYLVIGLQSLEACSKVIINVHFLITNPK